VALPLAVALLAETALIRKLVSGPTAAASKSSISSHSPRMPTAKRLFRVANGSAIPKY
jgi:hypothetical protein